jgi:hypothetical protein
MQEGRAHGCARPFRVYIAGNVSRETLMPASHATVPTASASRYLQQLCKHWSHKFAVEFTPEHGTIPFDATRRCTLDASPERLALRIEAADDAALERTQGVVIDHLKRFAFREELGEVRWERV